jgi:serine/threonine protein kinase/tetratricopeptide (TPR) repeat protein
MSSEPINAETLFARAIEIESPAERAAYLDRACADNPALRLEVEQLVADHFRAGTFLESPPVQLAATVDEPSTERPGAVIGPYKLLEQIGEGGFGIVFLAEQSQPVRRKVALKVLKAGMDTRQVIARFEAERQALAILNHPNIAKVFDGGATPSGRPYFVMELVRGVPITQFCDEQKLSPRQRLELFLPICNAVQHAHQKGIIHRDLKPSNVLVSRHDTTPMVKVIDFGVAKALGEQLTDKTLFTGVAQMIGTPLYMSPEQAGMSDLDVDTRSDIYSLGVLLYELLTGTTPFTQERFKKAAYDEIRRIIREEDPPKPSTRLSESKDSLPSISAQRQTEPAKLTRLVRGELDWIVMKALEKDRNRRYETADGFGKDIERYLVNEPVQACPPSTGYRLRKFLRRNKGPVAAASLILLSLVGGIIGTTAGMVWAVRERDDKAKALIAETKEREAKDKALAAEKEARARAMDALRTMTDEIVENQMARGTILTEENKEFLRNIIKRFEGFATVSDAEVDSRAIRAEGYLRVGLMRDRLGELKDAETAYSTALAVYKQLASDFPDRPEFRQSVGRSHNKLGVLFQGTGRLKEAEEAYAAALAIRKQLAVDFPTQPDYRRELAGTHGNHGYLLLSTGRFKEAERAYGAGLALFIQLVADFPTRPEFRQELALSHDNMGMLLRDTGRMKEAAQAHNAGIAVQKQLVVDFPNRPQFRQDLARSHFNLGRLFRLTGSEKDAESAIAAALALQKQLAADFPTRPDIRLELAQSHNGLGIVFVETGRLREAENALRAGLEVTRRLAADFPTRPDIRRNLAATHGNLGGVLDDLGRLKEAEEAYVAALTVNKQLAADFPNQPDLQNDLAAALGNLALLHLKKRDFQAARSRLEEALPHHDAVLKANPANSTYRQFYRNNLAALVQASAGLADRTAARQVAQKLRDLAWDPATDAYDAACALARCIPIVAGAPKQKFKDDRDKRAAFYGDEAMSMLRDAVIKGFKGAARLKKDDDLAPLRGRADFKKLVAQLEAGTNKEKQ